MTAQEILKMIESVDPADTAKLDEIDARVWCYLNEKTFIGKDSSGFYVWDSSNDFRFKEVIDGKITQASKSICGDGGHSFCPEPVVKKYTRSRDTLKAIRPEGWEWDMMWNETVQYYGAGSGFEVWSPANPALPTEELAELHAIIQAIDYEMAASTPK